MSRAGIQVDGIRETVRSLEKLGAAVADLKAAFKKIGQNVANDAKKRTNAKSGRLANSIKPSNTKNKSVVRAGKASVPYAGVINYGWPAHNIAPKQYLNDAIEAQEHNTVRTLETELGTLIDRYGLNN